MMIEEEDILLDISVEFKESPKIGMFEFDDP